VKGFSADRLRFRSSSSSSLSGHARPGGGGAPTSLRGHDYILLPIESSKPDPDSLLD